MPSRNTSHPASITFHFDGPIAENHQVTIRTLGKTLDHLQNAIDRSYLDVTYGNVMKHQRLKLFEYSAVDFYALAPRDGGFIMEMVSATGKLIADRMAAAVTAAYEKDIAHGEVEHMKLLQQAELREKLFKKNGEAIPFNDFVAKEEKNLAKAFGDRAIAKEIDQVLSLIRADRHEGSTFELSIYGTRSHPKLEFDDKRATRFHAVVSDRRLGDPIILNIELRSLDAGRANQIAHGKARNVESGVEFNFMVPTAKVFDRLARNLKRRARKVIRVIACPIYEYNAYDPNAGDVVLINFQGEVDD